MIVNLGLNETRPKFVTVKYIGNTCALQLQSWAEVHLNLGSQSCKWASDLYKTNISYKSNNLKLNNYYPVK